MEESKTISAIAIVLSLLAFFSCIGIGCYMYFDKPIDVDISGITENRIDINDLLSDVNEIQKDIDDIPLVEVTEEDLEDLEDDIKDLENNIEECAEDNPNNATELASCLKKI